VLRIVKDMVDAGAAQMVLGNHEFNAMAYHTEDPAKPGKYLRPHGDPENGWSEKNERQHKAFVGQVRGKYRKRHLKWFWTQPLWLDLTGYQWSALAIIVVFGGYALLLGWALWYTNRKA